MHGHNLIRDLLQQYRQSILDCEPGECNGRVRMVPDRTTSHRHAAWMIDQMLDPGWDWTNRDKTNRWLGFIQGVLWMEGGYSINQLRDQTRPIAEKSANSWAGQMLRGIFGRRMGGQ